MIFVVTEEIHHEGARILGAAETLEDAMILAEGHIHRQELPYVTPWIAGQDQDKRRNWWTGGTDLFITEVPVMEPIKRTCSKCGRTEGTFACNIRHQHLNTGAAKAAND